MADDNKDWEEWIAANADHATIRGIRDGSMGKPFNPPRNADPVYRQEYAWGYDRAKNKEKYDREEKEEKERSERKGCAASFIVMGLIAPLLPLAGYGLHVL